MLLSFMIVFLIANKIGSFGVRDEEEEEELREKRRGWRSAGRREGWTGPGCLLPERERGSEREKHPSSPVSQLGRT